MVVRPRSAVIAAPDAFPPAGVTAIVFDVVGTLVEPAVTVADTYAAAGRRQGVDLDPATVARRFATAWRRQESIDAVAAIPFATSRDRERERWREIVTDVFGPGGATAAIFTDLWAHFALPASWRTVHRGATLAQAAGWCSSPAARASPKLARRVDHPADPFREEESGGTVLFRSDRNHGISGAGFHRHSRGHLHG